MNPWKTFFLHEVFHCEWCLHTTIDFLLYFSSTKLILVSLFYFCIVKWIERFFSWCFYMTFFLLNLLYGTWYYHVVLIEKTTASDFSKIFSNLVDSEGDWEVFLLLCFLLSLNIVQTDCELICLSDTTVEMLVCMKRIVKAVGP